MLAVKISFFYSLFDRNLFNCSILADVLPASNSLNVKSLEHKVFQRSCVNCASSLPVNYRATFRVFRAIIVPSKFKVSETPVDSYHWQTNLSRSKLQFDPTFLSRSTFFIQRSWKFKQTFSAASNTINQKFLFSRSGKVKVKAKD